MGGYAYVIPGSVSDDALQRAAAAAAPSGWLRVFRRAPPVPLVTTLPNGSRIFDLPPGPMGPALIDDLGSWIHSRLTAPTAATRAVLDYLRTIEPRIHVRGVQRAGEVAPRYFLEIAFSGCAGMAQTSSRVAVHWTASWYRAEAGRLDAAYFVPFGFTRTPDDGSPEEEFFFLPAGDLGYLEYVPPNPAEAQEASFSLDDSTVEAHEGDPRLERLLDLFDGYMAPPRCRCQLCDPEFGDAVP